MAALPRALPALIVGVIVAAYWYRVLRMARKARRRTGRAAHLVPPEPLGRALRLLWAPAVGVWVAHPFVSAAAVLAVRDVPHPLRPLWDAPAVGWAGAVLAAGCFIATRACWRRMGTAWRMGIDPGETTPLVATGPYAYVRHPIYALSAAMMAGTVAAVPSPLLLAVGGVHVALLIWESKREERHLTLVHGQAYEHYRRQVGGFLPRSWRAFTTEPLIVAPQSQTPSSS